MFSKRVAFITLLAVCGYVAPAHAVSATLSAGTAINPDTNTADGGTFTTQPYTRTTTFNTGSPTTSKSGSTTTYTYTSGIFTYTWSTTATTSPTSIKSDQYAPPPPNGQVINQTAASTSNNTSNYLAVFSGSPVTITVPTGTYLNYIGIDWGYADAYNQIQFYHDSTLLNTYVVVINM